MIKFKIFDFDSLNTFFQDFIGLPLKLDENKFKYLIIYVNFKNKYCDITIVLKYKDVIKYSIACVTTLRFLKTMGEFVLLNFRYEHYNKPIKWHISSDGTLKCDIIDSDLADLAETFCMKCNTVYDVEF